MSWKLMRIKNKAAPPVAAVELAKVLAATSLAIDAAEDESVSSLAHKNMARLPAPRESATASLLLGCSVHAAVCANIAGLR
ncbi:hypothetical protein [Xanthomonas oryzae]|uniref:hypothetical protein n=2 Tax=Xanthomonas oryzae TaxID=347 RepID=UPI00096F6EBB|nr:hypothetical protein [Xanthomonas oryzae]MEC5079578.1 hypothetical protein [Xanthomonas oryzae pv. oryzicola]UBB92881.1 hypothetical protein K2I41_20065 [Xanthomonas oryzae pv. oryzicola]ULX24333.1 hypothetical protein IYN96_19325 [Xanthomonas oryzae pv. oryzicola]UNW42382.1 hypothetical protein H4J00_19520 [Xanthomonas oryzae pv. oryzicola]WGY44135.1 hypothetical protein HED68_19750 [Xanthomonas oryzae pv. oryzicola]